jgi:lipopolysaccharide transport system permease protein
MQRQKELIIQANQENHLDFKELWDYRELFFFFAWRDIKVRYKQTAIGAGWAILQPVLATGIFTLFFNRVAGISSGNASIPYPIFAYLGLMYWNSFNSTINTVANSLLSNTGVLLKVYFPRLLPPLSATALSIVDFLFASLFFFGLLFVYHMVPHIAGILLFIPALLLIQYGATAIGIFFAALNVKYRDVRTALPFLTQLLLFVTPVIYPVSLVPEKLRIYLNLNPAAGAISMIRAGFFGTPINWLGVVLSFISATVAMAIALVYFKKTERNFVDII